MANGGMGQLGPAEVELEHQVVRLPRIALVGHGQRGQLLQAFDIVQRHAVPGNVVDLAGFQRRRACRRVGDDAKHDAVQVGLALVPVVLVADQVDLLTLGPALEFEGTGPDRFLVVGIGENVGVFVKMPRQHGQALCVQEVQHDQRRALEFQDGRVIVGGGDVVEVGQDVSADRVDLFPDFQRAVLHVGRGEGAAVVPLHLLAQREFDRQGIGGDFPGRRQRGTGLVILVVGEQPLQNVGRDHTVHVGVVVSGIERHGFGLNHRPKNAARGRRLGHGAVERQNQ